MFKKLLENIQGMITKTEKRLVAQVEDHNIAMCRATQEIVRTSDNINSNVISIKNKVGDIVESQQRTIEVLTNALCDKYKDGLFIYSEDGKIPTVIRNGKELTDDLTQEFSINWSIGEFPNINIEQIAGTHKDMEMQK